MYTPEMTRLLELPSFERAVELELILMREIRHVLHMSEGEQLSIDASFFEMGLTSLTLNDVKQNVETRYGLEIGTNALFNAPSIRDLASYVDRVISFDFAGDHGPADPSPSSAAQANRVSSNAEAVADGLIGEILKST